MFPTPVAERRVLKKRSLISSFFIYAAIAAPITYVVTTMIVLHTAGQTWYSFWFVPHDRAPWLCALGGAYMLVLFCLGQYVFSLKPMFDKKNVAQAVVRDKSAWIPLAEKRLADFLNSKYAVTLDVERGTNPDASLTLRILVNGYEQVCVSFAIAGTETAEQCAAIVADHLINSYRLHHKGSSLFKALKAHDDFVTAEKRFKKTSRPIRDIDPPSQ